MKKIFTLFAALTMVMSMSAATKTIYFKTQQWWHKDDAASAAYYWDPSAAPTWPGIRMTKVDGVADMWSVDVDTDKYKNIIFTRVNGSGNVEDWGAKTQDLVIPTDDKNLFTLSTTEVWGGSGASGTWSVYAPDAPKTYKDITITVVANATPKIHYWEGGDKVTGSEWETKPDMVATGEENTYSYTIKDVDEATGVKYLIVVGEVQSADQQAFENVTANFKDLLPQVVVMGVTGWTGDKMTVADDYLSASVTLNLKAATDYELKLTVNGQWYGSNAITITKDNNSASFAENGEGNGKLTTDLAGDYVLTYTYATKTLVVTYPVPTPTYTVTVSHNTYSYESITTGGGEYEEGATATVTASENVEGWVFLGWTENGEFVANDLEYAFTVEGDIELVATYAQVMEEEITNLVIDTELMALIGGPSAIMQVDVFLGLSEYDDEEGYYLLSEESSVSIMGQEATWFDGMAFVESETSATAIVIVEFEGMYYSFTLNMSAAPAEPIEVVVENATVTLTEYEVSETESAYELVMIANWTYEKDGLTYEVECLLPTFDPTNESGNYAANFYVRGDGAAFGMAEGANVLVTVENQTLKLTGEISAFNGNVYNVTISGTLPSEEPEVITWELNGGELVVEVPTQEELWASFKTAAGLTTLGTLAEITEAGAGKPHSDQNNPCACRIICAKLLDANVNAVFALPEWAWLKAYIMTVQSGLPEASSAAWRYAFAAFFLQSEHNVWPASADFTEAGKPENWGAAYEAAHEVVLPTEPVAEEYVLPTPVKTGYTFVGWYDNAEGTGEAYTVIPAGWSGTLYAIWKQNPTTALENIAVEGKVVKAIVNGQLIIIKNGVQYNAQGAVVK